MFILSEDEAALLVDGVLGHQEGGPGGSHEVEGAGHAVEGVSPFTLGEVGVTEDGDTGAIPQAHERGKRPADLG
jgi:hypothetical protein